MPCAVSLKETNPNLTLIYFINFAPFYLCDNNEWLINWRCRALDIFSDSGAFKTLDKDNNGTIKVNVQEVKRFQLF